MATITLHGEIADVYGSEKLCFSVESPREAIRAICANKPRMKKYFYDKRRKGLGVYILADRKITENEGHFNKNGAEEYDIIPYIGGAGNVAAQIVISLIIAAVSAGISSLLAPDPKIPKQQQQEIISEAGANSYTFNSRVNNLVQGVPVPIVYGRFKVGSNVVSGYVKNVDQFSILGIRGQITLLIRRYYPGNTIVFDDASSSVATVRTGGLEGSPQNTNVNIGFKDRIGLTFTRDGYAPRTIWFYDAKTTDVFDLGDNKVRVNWITDWKDSPFRPTGSFKSEWRFSGYSIFNLVV